jgi:hypothetical protein
MCHLCEERSYDGLWGPAPGKHPQAESKPSKPDTITPKPTPRASEDKKHA